jgi:hypothetical protein
MDKGRTTSRSAEYHIATHADVRRFKQRRAASPSSPGRLGASRLQLANAHRREVAEHAPQPDLASVHVEGRLGKMRAIGMLR